MTSQNEPVRIVVTGGTIDKEYDQIGGQLVFTRTHVADMLEQARCRRDHVLEKVMLKDSLYMTDEDRELILARCQASPESRIIITHGTDTMPETARCLMGRLPGKTVVLFGAMVPYSFVHSDAAFNLGFAFAAAQLLPEGVYVTMNGRVFPAATVRKVREAGVFEEQA